MIRSIITKEWIKIRKYAFWALILSIAFEGYLFIQLYAVYRLRGPVFLWEMAISRDVIFVELYRYIPLIIGVLAGLSQFIPEMQDKRLKLTLHLPFHQQKMIGYMLGTGLTVTALIFLVNFLLMAIVLRWVFASEIVWRIMITTMEWYLSGLIGYILTAWICLEPRWVRRLPSILLSVACIYILFISNNPEAYNSLLITLLLCLGLLTLLPFGAVQHFKNGEQDH